MSDKPNEKYQSMTIRHNFKARALRRRTTSFYSVFCSGALALLAGLGGLGYADAQEVGATVPWVRYEAEDCPLLGGAKIEGPSWDRNTFAVEASNRKCVRLTTAGDGIRFTVQKSFSALVIRVSLPDAEKGGGSEDFIQMTAGANTHRLPLTSKYAWVYGDETKKDQLNSNEPPEPGYTGPFVRMRFDEARFRLPAVVPAGTVVEITKPRDAKSAWLVLDLVEVELVPPPIPQPAGYLSVAEFGAKTDGSDAGPACLATIAAAQEKKTGVYFPPGRYRLGNPLTVQNLSVQGAGIWETELSLEGARPRSDAFIGAGGKISVSDLSILGSSTTRSDSARGFSGWYGPGSRIDSVWIEHTVVGAWIGDYVGTNVTDGLTFSRCRVRNTYADGINFVRGTRNSIIEQCHFRGNIDDSVASWSSDAKNCPPTAHNIFRYNTIENTLRAGGIGLFGGEGHQVHHNLIRDTFNGGGIRFSCVFPGHPFGATEPMRIYLNQLVRCGGLSYGREHNGAIDLCSHPNLGELRQVWIESNTIIDPAYSGIHLHCAERQGQRVPITGIVLEGNTIRGADEYGICIEDKSLGWLTSTNNRIEGARLGEIYNKSDLEIRSGAKVPAPAARLSAMDMTVTQDGTVMTVTGARYTARLSLPQGSLLSLRDQAAGQEISLGNSGGHLWVAHFIGRNDVKSGDYAAANVTWSWDAAKQTLTILYSASGDKLPAVRAQWQFSDQAWLDLSLTVDNQTGCVLRGVENNLRLPAATLESAILPVLPGIQLQRKFFTDRREWRHGQYPRALVFADYAHFRAGRATLSTFPILDRDLTQVARRELFPDGEAYVWRHNFELAEASGKVWTSPRLRFRVGDSEADGARAFRDDTGLGLVPSLHQKLGERYDRVVSSLSTKAGAEWMVSDFRLTLADQAGYSKIWQGLPGPALLFITGWSRGGFDESNPDIFPVDPRLGTDDQWKQVFQSASAAGHLNMPYLNHTFWNVNSETVKSMDPKEFASYRADGMPLLEHYGSKKKPHTGYATCPYAPATKVRIARVFKELSQKMPVDLVWEDQIGARFSPDYNPHSPNPLWHAQGWLEHTRTYAKLGLMTEFGYDRMVETHVGFQGNYILAEQQHWGDFGPKYWGEDTWRIWPVVPMMARDKVMFYNAPDNSCVSKQVLTWSLSMGQMLSWALTGNHYRDPWHFTADAFQRHVIARFADQTLQDFAVLTNGITRSNFGDYTVWANESSTQEWQAPDGPRLVPGGCWVTDRQGRLSAGIFTAFNGQPLTVGDHYLIVETRDKGITVRHLQGPDTPLSLKIAKPVRSVTAQLDQGKSEVPFRMENGQVYLDINSKLQGQDVRSYELSFEK